MSSQESSKGKQRATEILDVEDEEQRHERIHGLFSKLNASNAVCPRTDTRPFDFGGRSTFAVEPPLELLSRVQAFLPELAASNADLLRRAKEDPSSVDIENVDREAAEYIEMNLGLGVFDHHGPVPAGITVAEVDVDLNQDVQTEDSDCYTDSDSSNSSSGASSFEGADTDTESGSGSDSDSDSGSDSDSDIDIVLDPSDSAQTKAARPIKPLPKRSLGKPGIVVVSSSDRLGV